MDTNAKVQGVVKTVTDKGFGFIQTSAPEAGGKDIFYHEKSLTGDLAFRKLKVGDKVEFEIEEGMKGKNAVSISLIDGDDSSDQDSE
jgi:cold shock CspA family protein